LSNPAYNDDSESWRIPVDIVADEMLLASESAGASTGGDFLKKEKDPALQQTE
jgi:hypothetical protein